MKTWFVSRHPGAKALAKDLDLAIDCWVEHLDPALVEPGDRVYGTLPVPLAAKVTELGARYFHLMLDLPSSLRGKELSVEEMRDLKARFEEYRVFRAIP